MQSEEKLIASLRSLEGPKFDDAIKQRVKQYEGFLEIKENLRNLIDKCANSKISNAEFYAEMMRLWFRKRNSRPPIKLQGSGFQIRCKRSNWQDVCLSIKTIFNASEISRDDIVKEEIDRLAKARHPARRTWMSEMLCLYYREQYHLDAGPVREWLKHVKYPSHPKESQGTEYISCALMFRELINLNKRIKVNEAQNLVELDHAIWKWYNLTK